MMSGTSLRIIGSLSVLWLYMFVAGCASVAVTPELEHPPRALSIQPVENAARPVVAFVLGGGAARGFAHVGALKVLDENGIHADLIVGTSAGSVVGALYAGGIRGDALMAMARQLARDKITDWTFPDRGVVRGQLLQQYVNDALDNHPIENLETTFVAVATDLGNGRLVAFNAGDVGMAVRASSAIPGLVQPVTINGSDFVDGGLVSPVPVHVARQYGADIIIAIDVSRSPQAHQPLDSTLSVMQQALVIMSHRIAAVELKDADILISPVLDNISLAEFDMREHAIAQGEKAANEVMPAIKRLLQQKGDEISHRGQRRSESQD